MAIQSTYKLPRYVLQWGAVIPTSAGGFYHRIPVLSMEAIAMLRLLPAYGRVPEAVDRKREPSHRFCTLAGISIVADCQRFSGDFANGER